MDRYTGGVLLAAIGGRLAAGTSGACTKWPEVAVADVGEVLLGRRRAPEYANSTHERKYLRVANVRDDFIDYSDLESMRFDAGHALRYQLVPGDVLVSEGQSPERLGQSAIFRGYAEPLCFQSTLHRFRANRRKTSPEFAQIVFRAHVRSGVFRQIGSITTNIGHLTLEKFKAAPFPLPSVDEQLRIVAEVDRRLSIVREVDTEVGVNLRRVRILRQAILSKLFGV
jgi:type I restriction enzyme S subunit